MKSIFRFLFVLFCLFTTTNPLHAQWTAVNSGLTNLNVEALAFSGTNLFAGTSLGGVFLSTNNGSSWAEVSTGLSTHTTVTALAFSGTNLFAGTYGGGVFLSTNNGSSWSPASTGLWNLRVTSLAFSDTNLFAGTYSNGIFLSTNNGTSWTGVNTGLTNTFVLTLAVSGTNLFAGCYYGYADIFLSTNNGTSWSAESTGSAATSVQAIAFSGTNLFAGIYGGAFGVGAGVFRSTNNGTSWTEVNTGLPTNTNVYALTVYGTNLFAGAWGGGIWRRPLSEMNTSVERLSTDLPRHFSLDQNYPNPFNPATTISFGLPSESFVSLKVFDALGRELSILVADEFPAGTYTLQWNAAGLPSGTYFYRLRAGTSAETKKLLLLK